MMLLRFINASQPAALCLYKLAFVNQLVYSIYFVELDVDLTCFKSSKLLFKH